MQHFLSSSRRWPFVSAALLSVCRQAATRNLTEDNKDDFKHFIWLFIIPAKCDVTSCWGSCHHWALIGYNVEVHQKNSETVKLFVSCRWPEFTSLKRFSFFFFSFKLIVSVDPVSLPASVTWSLLCFTQTEHKNCFCFFIPRSDWMYGHMMAFEIKRNKTPWTVSQDRWCHWTPEVNKSIISYVLTDGLWFWKVGVHSPCQTVTVHVDGRMNPLGRFNDRKRDRWGSTCHFFPWFSSSGGRTLKTYKSLVMFIWPRHCLACLKVSSTWLIEIICQTKLWLVDELHFFS